MLTSLIPFLIFDVIAYPTVGRGGLSVPCLKAEASGTLSVLLCISASWYALWVCMSPCITVSVFYYENK